MAPRKVTREDLAAVTRAALGSDRKVKGVTRLAGGTTKGVYRLTVDDDTNAAFFGTLAALLQERVQRHNEQPARYPQQRQRDHLAGI